MVALRAILESDSTSAIPEELHASLEALRNILEDQDMRALPEDVHTAIVELQSTLAAAKVQLRGESPEIYQMTNTLKEVELTARALREFWIYSKPIPKRSSAASNKKINERIQDNACCKPIDDHRRHLSLLLSACGSSPPVHYFSLNPIDSEFQPGADDAMLLGLGPLRLPDYLNRSQMVTRGGISRSR